MSTARATPHTASDGDSAAAPAAAALPLASPPTHAPRRSKVGRSEKAAAVIARLPDVSTTTQADSPTRLPDRVTSAKQWLGQHVHRLGQRVGLRWAGIRASWQLRTPLPRNRRRAAIIGGAVVCGLGLVAVALMVAPRLGKTTAGSGASQPAIADGASESLGVETSPVGPSGATASLWSPPTDSAAGTDTHGSGTHGSGTHVSGTHISGTDNLASPASPMLFPSLPDPGGVSAITSTPDTATSNTAFPNTVGPRLTPPASGEAAAMVANQPYALTPPDASPARQSSGSEVFTWHRNEAAAAQQRSTGYDPTHPSAATGAGSFRAPQATPATDHAERPYSHHDIQPNAIVTDRYQSGYQPAPLPNASVAAPYGVMPEDTVPMTRHFPTTEMAWSNQRRQWATTGDRPRTTPQPPAATVPYHGYGPGTAAPYAAGPSNYRPDAPTTSALGGQDAYIGQQPHPQSLRR